MSNRSAEISAHDLIQTSTEEPSHDVGIIGCGWLGKALAKALRKEGQSVLATRSSQENCDELRAQGIHAQMLLLPEVQATLNKHNVFNCKTIVIAITPQFRKNRVDYPDKVIQLVAAAQQSNHVSKVILLSSSAIYNGLSGTVSEDAALDFTADKVALLSQAEQAVLAFTNQELSSRSYVLRLSGLVGEDRHPGKFLAGKSEIKINANAPVNLIHQQDAVGIISALINLNIPLNVINGVSQTKASKQDYYQAAAKALSLPAPVFSNTPSLDVTRTVNGDKARQLLSYQSVYPDLLSWL